MGETTEKYLIPEIRKDGGIATLYVKGEPFFALSGEIHNSSASSLESVSYTHLSDAGTCEELCQRRHPSGKSRTAACP